MTIFWIFLVLFLAYTLLCLIPRGMPKPWHEDIKAEFRAHHAAAGMDLKGYLEKEDHLFQQLEELCGRVRQEDTHGLNRFCPNALTHSTHYSFGLPEGCQNWNRTFLFAPAAGKQLRGGVLLLHGMFDAPYSMRAVAEIYRDLGFYVLCPRLPGHGLQPGGLLSVTVEDWLALVHLAARDVCQKIGDAPFLIGGFSNGAALALGYTLDSLDSEARTPDHLFFFSPEIGINPLARVLNLHKLISWMPFLHKFKWWSIRLEYDPFKYRSIANNVPYQASRITRRNKRMIRDLGARNLLGTMPHTLCFQSVVDDTVRIKNLIEDFFDLLPPGNHELVLFDLNRFAGYAPYMQDSCKKDLERFGVDQIIPKSYSLTLISNASNKTHTVVAKTKGPGSSSFAEPGTVLDEVWPPYVFSQTHISIPFKPSDPIYGDGEAPQYTCNPDWNTPSDEGFPRFPLGSLRPLAERAVSCLPASALNRLHYNVFFGYLEQRLVEAVEAELTASP